MSATVITDSTGEQIRHLTYRAFGEQAENTGPGLEPKYTYTGKEADATGLLYYGARYYDPVLARFLTPDTIYDAGPQGLNRYSDALNNPILYRDPTGNLSYTDDDNPAVWEEPRSPEEIPLTLGPEKADETDDDAYIDLGDGVRAKKLAPWEADPARWPGLRAQPKRSFWRTNPVSRYIADVIMTGRSLVSSDYGWEHCNPITGDCYLPGESFDRKFMVIIDIASAAAIMKANKLFDPSKALNDEVIDAIDTIDDYLGPGAKSKLNESGDLILESADGTRKVRFDINNPSPHKNPHSHVEEFKKVKNKMKPTKKSGPRYPKDVTHE